MSNPIRYPYASGEHCFGDLYLPSQLEPAPVVVLIHGGFWRATYGLELMVPLAENLVADGYAVWSIEYSRVTHDGGGFPGTLIDVAAAIDHVAKLAELHPVDRDRVAVVGHSAGGHLAAWVGGREHLNDGDPGAQPSIIPNHVVPQAGVINLPAAATDFMGNGAVIDFLGGEQVGLEDAYRVATPQVGTPHVAIVHGTNDEVVPRHYGTYASAPLASTSIEWTIIEGADHMDMIDPAHAAWASVRSAIADHLNAT